MKLPITISAPHSGTRTPPEVSGLSIIDASDVIKDGDEQAAEIYHPLQDDVIAFVTTDIARAFVDMNRAPDDFRKDGVVKTHTCWDVPIYRHPPDTDTVTALLERYYHPYHGRLRDAANAGDAMVGVDCHTMAAAGPPVGPDPGAERPWACVSDGDGTCDRGWTEALATILARELGGEVRVNDPFKGGYITRTHAKNMPWLQLELSRGGFASADQKRAAVLSALREWSDWLLHKPR